MSKKSYRLSDASIEEVTDLIKRANRAIKKNVKTDRHYVSGYIAGGTWNVTVRRVGASKFAVEVFYEDVHLKHEPYLCATVTARKSGLGYNMFFLRRGADVARIFKDIVK